MQVSEENPSNELVSRYDFHEFKTIMEELYHTFNLKHAPTPVSLYDRIIIQKGVVTGFDIADQLQLLKQEETIHSQLSQQIIFYKQKIGELRQKGYSSIAKNKFIAQFLKGNQSIGLISQEIQIKIQKVEYISLDKLESFVNKFNDIEIKGKQPVVPIGRYSLTKSSIFVDVDYEYQFNWKNTLKEMSEFLRKNIYDDNICYRFEEFLEKLSIGFKQLEEKYEQNEESRQKLHETMTEMQEALFTSQRSYNENIGIADKKIQGLKQEIRQKSDKTKQYIVAIATLEEQNQKLTKQLHGLMTDYTQNQKQLEWFKQNYQLVHQEYQQYLQQQQRVTHKQLQDQQKKLFSQRTLKQQLEDATAKIDKLRSEKNKLSDQLISKQAYYNNQITQLEQRLGQNQEQLRNLRSNNQLASIKSQYYLAGNYQNRYHQDSTYSKISTITNQLNNNKDIRKSIAVITSEVQSNYNHMFKKKQQKISDEVSMLLDDQNQMIYSNDQLLIADSKELNNQAEQIHPDLNDPLKHYAMEFMSCGVQMVHQSGTYFPMGFVVLLDRIMVLDTKNRYSYAFKFNQLKWIYLCHYNSSWIVLKFKPNQVRDNGITISDMVFHLKNRQQFCKFISNECKDVELKYQKQNNIWITHSTKKQILLSHYIGYYDLFKISVNNSHNLFEANIKQSGLLNFSYDVFLVVTDIGVVCFEKDDSQMIQKSQKIVAVIPIVQLMAIQFNKSKIQINITYQLSKRKIKIKTKSVAVVWKIKQAIEERRKVNLSKKQEMILSLGVKSIKIGASKVK